MPDTSDDVQPLSAFQRDAEQAAEMASFLAAARADIAAGDTLPAAAFVTALGTRPT